MLHEVRRELTVRAATELQPIGTARYRTTATFIEYFRARNRSAISDDQLAQYLARPRCLAASYALYAGHLTQSVATWYVRQDLEQLFETRLDRTRHWSFPERCVELVTHVARLFYLPAANSGRPHHDTEAVRALCQAYKSDHGLTDPTIWRVRVARFTTGPASLLHDRREQADHRRFVAAACHLRRFAGTQAGANTHAAAGRSATRRRRRRSDHDRGARRPGPASPHGRTGARVAGLFSAHLEGRPAGSNCG